MQTCIRFDLPQGSPARAPVCSRRSSSDQRRAAVVIKDILVNASVTSSHDVAIDFAVSIATAFEAHIVATAQGTDREGSACEI
jgi:hypothetical protein